MTSRRGLLPALALLATAGSAFSSTGSFWVEPAPRDAAESQLRASVAGAAFQGVPAAARALLAQADQQPGTPAAALARLSAGWLLVDAGFTTDAIAVLRHPDLERSPLLDHARFALARALEGSGDRASAAFTYAQAAEAAGLGPLRCTALLRSAEVAGQSGDAPQALAALDKAIAACPQQRPRALARAAELRGDSGDRAGAAQALDRLDREFPASAEALAEAPRLAALAPLVPAQTEAERLERRLARGVALVDAGRAREAIPQLQGLLATRGARPETLDLARLKLGQALLATRRAREAVATLRAVPATSPHAAQAAFLLAGRAPKEADRLSAWEGVATRYPGTPWAEEALLALANHYQKDALDEQAAPHFQRLLTAFPQGRWADRAAWRVGFAAFRAGRFEEAATVFEQAVRVRPVTGFTPGFLYWSGRARQRLGQPERARQLLQETVLRFKRSYHGARATEALRGLGAPAAGAPALAPVTPESDIPEPQLTRLRQLLLIERVDEALEELRALPPSPAMQATVAWLESRRGRLRPAITAMKRAYPDWVGAAGDQLPDAVWRILYPLEFRAELEGAAVAQGLDPALVAALICQESTFEAGAVSSAGARGLMQIMPATGRLLARQTGLRYSRAALHQPSVSLQMGTRYLRDLLDRFGGSAEKALAAYNAGPHRVEAWTALRPHLTAEEFVESIPFTETRNYVMIILAAREQYRRIYGLDLPAPGPAAASVRP